MLSKLKEMFTGTKEEYTPPTDAQIEEKIRSDQIQDISVVKIKEATINLNHAEIQVLEADKNILLARIEGTKWRNDKKAGRVDSAKQMRGIQEACYLYGNRHELLQEKLRDSIRDCIDAEREADRIKRDADVIVADAYRTQNEVRDRLVKLERKGLMSNF